MKTLLIILALILTPILSFGADLSMRWDAASGATGYRIQMSTDLGVTWSVGIDVGNVTTYTYLAVPENALILFRLSSYNAQGSLPTVDRGCWFDGRKSLPSYAINLGVK